MEKYAKKLQDIINEQDFCFEPEEIKTVEKALGVLRMYEDANIPANAGPIRDGSSGKVNTEAESKKRHGRCSRRSHRARNNSSPMRAADSAAMNEVFTPVYECQYITKE